MALKPHNASISISMTCVLFPIKWSELVNSLEKLGFTINEDLPYPVPLGRVSGSGKIGQKGRALFLVNAGDKSLRVVDRTIKDAKTSFDDLFKTLQHDYDFDLEKYVEYRQITSSHIYKIENSAYGSMSKSCSMPNIEKFSEILGIDVTPFGIRLGQSGAVTNSENWFDVKITPDVERDDGFLIETVYRNADNKTFTEFINSYEDKIVKLMKMIGGK